MSDHIHLDILGLVFFTALFISLFVVPATIVLARKVGAVDVPKDRSSHTIPTTRLGGLGIVASLVISCLLFLPLNAFTWAFITGLLLVILTGLVDDMADIGPRWKFVGQVVAAGSFVGMGGGSLEHLGNFFGLGEMTLGLAAVPFTIFCMVGAMNAFNLSDGLDGLAGGMATIATVTFAFFSWHSGEHDLMLVSVALLGALMGFLRYNSYPAKLFMGDCGSLTLGYVLAALLVSGSQRPGIQIPLVAWAMVIALPLLDTLLVMARRVYHGHSPFLPDRTHLHHRLMALGLAHPGVVAVMYTAMASFGAVALALHDFADRYMFAALWIMGAVLFGGVSVLQRTGFMFDIGRQKRPYSRVRQWPLFIRFSRSITASVVPVSIVLLASLCLAALFLPLPELDRNEAMSLLMLSGMVLYYGMHLTTGYKGMLHGSIYVSIFVLFFIYNCGNVDDGHWPRVFLTTISSVTALWVLFKVAFRESTAILMTSSFELLMVFLSWFLPFVLFEELRLPGNVIDAGRLACLQVLPFMLATKVYFKVQPEGNKWVVGAFAGSMALVALRGYF